MGCTIGRMRFINKLESYSTIEVNTLLSTNSTRFESIENSINANTSAIASLTQQDAVLTEFNNLKPVVHTNQTAISNLQVTDNSLQNQMQSNYLGYFDITNNRLPTLTNLVNSNTTAISTITSVNNNQTNTLNLHVTAISFFF